MVHARPWYQGTNSSMFFFRSQRLPRYIAAMKRSPVDGSHPQPYYLNQTLRYGVRRMNGATSWQGGDSRSRLCVRRESFVRVGPITREAERQEFFVMRLPIFLFISAELLLLVAAVFLDQPGSYFCRFLFNGVAAVQAALLGIWFGVGGIGITHRRDQTVTCHSSRTDEPPVQQTVTRADGKAVLLANIQPFRHRPAMLVSRRLA